MNSQVKCFRDIYMAGVYGRHKGVTMLSNFMVATEFYCLATSTALHSEIFFCKDLTVLPLITDFSFTVKALCKVGNNSYFTVEDQPQEG